MGNIIKELSLNKHPKEFKILSLINERNIMVSNDFSCLQIELSIIEYPRLQDYCNTEVVLFTCPIEGFGDFNSDNYQNANNKI